MNQFSSADVSLLMERLNALQNPKTNTAQRNDWLYWMTFKSQRTKKTGMYLNPLYFPGYSNKLPCKHMSYRPAELSTLEETLEGHLVQPPTQDRELWGQTRLLRALFSQLPRKSSKDRGSSASFSSLIQCLPTVKTVFFLVSFEVGNSDWVYLLPSLL